MNLQSYKSPQGMREETHCGGVCFGSQRFLYESSQAYESYKGAVKVWYTIYILSKKKLGKCEKSADLEMNWEISTAVTGHILPLSPLVAMDTVVFIS